MVATAEAKFAAPKIRQTNMLINGICAFQAMSLGSLNNCLSIRPTRTIHFITPIFRNEWIGDVLVAILVVPFKALPIKSLRLFWPPIGLHHAMPQVPQMAMVYGKLIKEPV